MIPPWKYLEEQDAGKEVVSAPAAEEHPYTIPKIYGRESFPEPDAEMPVTVKYKEKRVILFRDKVLIPRRIILNSDGTVCQATFRRRRINYHGGIKHVGNDLFKPRRDDYTNQSSCVDGPIYYADTEHPDIFGHFLIEVLPDLWAFHLLGIKNLKIATSVRMNESYLKMLNAIGISSDQIVHIDGPLTVDELYVPSEMIQRRRYLDPLVRDLFSRVGKLAYNSKQVSINRVYISRTKMAGRDLENEMEVEILFEKYGFTIIHPQELSIEDQIKIFRDARYIAGTGGSAMHNAIYSENNSKVLIISNETWFVLADSFICQEEGRLGYVFGNSIEPEKYKTKRHKSRWKVSIPDVENALKVHFGL